ncbi:hypothetical protein [Methanobrevibacter filiformis]|uniref:hypothetical protein n=1 Tax=Methanobrevibacter filiformis TaxID=55758 RepID=UPI000A7F2981|nr:hypothetical protein [Methanobrevibacter filiformis]
MIIFLINLLLKAFKEFYTKNENKFSLSSREKEIILVWDKKLHDNELVKERANYGKFEKMKNKNHLLNLLKN